MIYFVCQSTLQILDAAGHVEQSFNAETQHATLALAWREGERRKLAGHVDITLKSVDPKRTSTFSPTF